MAIKKALLCICLLGYGSGLKAQSSKLVQTVKLGATTYRLSTLTPLAGKTDRDTTFFILSKPGSKRAMVREIKSVTDRDGKSLVSSKYKVTGKAILFERLDEYGSVTNRTYTPTKKGTLSLKTVPAAASVSVPTINTSQVAPKSNEHNVVDIQPEFPGGISKLFRYISTNLRYPRQAQESNIQGKVFSTFIVEADGTISNIVIERSLGYGCDEEVIRLLKSMPKWKAGESKGQAVRTQFRLPISFVLSE